MSVNWTRAAAAHLLRHNAGVSIGLVLSGSEVECTKKGLLVRRRVGRRAAPRLVSPNKHYRS